jgi:iron complex transport system permease protein
VTTPARQGARRAAVLAGLPVLVVVAFLLLVTVGTVRIPLTDVLSVVTGGDAARPVYRTIVVDGRLPRAMAAACAGAALAVGGAMMQTIFRNPLADPSVLGVSSGAALGAAVVILGSTSTGVVAGAGVLTQLGATGAAVAGASAVLLIALAVARRVPSPVTVLVVGVMIGLLASAAVDVLVYYSDPERIAAFTGFTRGSVRDVTWLDLRVLGPVCAAVVVLSGGCAKALNVLLLGERYAATMGVPTKRTRFWCLAAVAVLSGVVTAYCGAIGFVGLAAPHLVRGLLHTSDHRLVLPATAAMGAALVLGAEFVAQGAGTSTASLPLNAVTAFIGVPVVLWVLVRRSGAARVQT